jgi:hypothetical protein
MPASNPPANTAPSLMASLYAKFTFIYRKTKVIFRLEDVKYSSALKCY